MKFDRESYKKAWTASNRDKVNAASRRYYERNKEILREKNSARMRANYNANLEESRRINREKKKIERSANPEKHRQEVKQYRLANMEKVKESVKRRWRENPEPSRRRVILWKKANPEKVSAAGKRYREAHPEMSRLKTARRRANMFCATPKWADLKAVRAIYADAVQKGLSVDHIVPLAGKNVCGLHVEFNLQLIPQNENVRKGNRFSD